MQKGQIKSAPFLLSKVIAFAARRHVGARFIRARPDVKSKPGTHSQQRCGVKYEG
jgi:hypothetical protein